ncbi:MAG: uracil-DNA glycosylase family protein [Opitutus sp.]|nr:uracil-DNA glycosylase family protein [Opitutus sp.]
MKTLLARIRSCRECERFLPHGPRPVIQAHPSARLLIIGQAPGARVHESGVPWQDASGKQLRAWLGVDEATFYDASKIALLPMGFCYPGKGTSGDLPPRPECAPLWHEQVLKHLKQIKLTLLIGQYAQRHYIGGAVGENLTETVRGFRQHLPRFLPPPHPSPRNRFWVVKNPWFESTLLPVLRTAVAGALQRP